MARTKALPTEALVLKSMCISHIRVWRNHEYGRISILTKGEEGSEAVYGIRSFLHKG